MLNNKPAFLEDLGYWQQYITAFALEPAAEVAVKAPSTEEAPDGETIIRNVNEALKQAHSLDILDRRLQSTLQRTMVQEEQLARDIAVFGDTHREEILDAHRITEADLALLLEEESFAQRIQALRTEINRDTKGLVRARAAMYLEAGLDNAYEIANNPHARDADRMKAIQFLATMADAVPRTAGGLDGGFGSGSANGALNVVFNFGSLHPQKDKLKGITIEGEAENA